MWRTSYPDDDVPQVLDSLDLQGIVKFIKSDSCKNVFVMAGAGISTSAGIPDFRSPDTGLYANLARLKLPYPEAVFDIGFFSRNPRPFYVLAHELAPGKFRPTPTHSFIRLLAEKGLLHTCFTQNIDTLERAAGVPAEKIIEAHGSFVDQHCIKCGAQYPHDEIKKKIAAQEIPRCESAKCNGLVKPDIVFFGESLPDAFIHGIPHLRKADLLIVMGTSLTVMPFASLTDKVPEGCPRLLLNLDHVGDFGSRVNDVEALMPCDDAVRKLCQLLGWEEELEKLWAETDLKKPEKEKAEETKKTVAGEPQASEWDKKGTLDEVVEKMAKEVGAVKLEDKAPAKTEEETAKVETKKAEPHVPTTQTQEEVDKVAKKNESKESEADLEKSNTASAVKDDVVDKLADIVEGVKLDGEKDKKDSDSDKPEGETL